MLGWTEGRNLRLEVRGANESVERAGTLGRELIDLGPDVIVTQGGMPTVTVQALTQSVPIVFVQAGDALANGLVKNIARPEGNSTGVSNNLPSFGGKWLELLKDAVPEVARVAVVFNPDITFSAYLGSIEEAAEKYRVMVLRTPVRNAVELERAIETFAGQPGGGVNAMPPPVRCEERPVLYGRALKHRLPAMFSTRAETDEGGLISYAADIAESFRLAASYVDRILRGAKPGDLPVQFPTRYRLVVNLKTAKAMGLSISEAFLLRADEVIE